MSSLRWGGWGLWMVLSRVGVHLWGHPCWAAGCFRTRFIGWMRTERNKGAGSPRAGVFPAGSVTEQGSRDHGAGGPESPTGWAGSRARLRHSDTGLEGPWPLDQGPASAISRHRHQCACPRDDAEPRLEWAWLGGQGHVKVWDFPQPLTPPLGGLLPLAPLGLRVGEGLVLPAPQPWR